MAFEWTPAAQQALERLWAEGVSPIEIAERLIRMFGGDVTNKAVSNRAIQTRLPKRAKAPVFDWTLPAQRELERMWYHCISAG